MIPNRMIKNHVDTLEGRELDQLIISLYKTLGEEPPAKRLPMVPRSGYIRTGVSPSMRWSTPGRTRNGYIPRTYGCPRT